MNKKIVIVTLFITTLVLLTGFIPALASQNNNPIAMKTDLVAIEVNRYLGKEPDRIYTTLTSAEAEEIKQDLISLYDAQQRSDHEAISKYEALLNEKGIFGNNYQKFYSNEEKIPLIEKTRFTRFLTSQNADNISNSLCYFNAIGEGAMLWGLGIKLLEGIVRIIQNASTVVEAFVLLLVFLPLLVVTMLFANLIPFRIFAPSGVVAVQNGSMSSVGTMGYKRVTIGEEPFTVNLSGFTGITINILPMNNRTSFLFVSGIALKVEGQNK